MKESDKRFYERLIEFHNTNSPVSRDMGPIWNSVMASYQNKVISAARSAVAESLSSEFENILPNLGYYGIDITGLGSWEALAIRCGILAAKNPEQPSSTLMPDTEAMKCKVAEYFGFPIPEQRLLYYCLIAESIRLRWGGEIPKSVLEIGAGMGNFAYIFRHWGAKDFTVIDLPSTAIIAAHYLSRWISEEDMWFFGEPDPETHKFLRFYPDTNFGDVAGMIFDLVINTDSFPEMPMEVRESYLKMISGVLSETGEFVSMNHESDNMSQEGVLSTVKRIGGLRLVSRHLFPYRGGYVEEVYKKA